MSPDALTGPDRAERPPPESGGASALDPVIALLDAVHRPKDLAYRDAWRKRGELLSIFANLARKVDRLEVAMGELEPSEVESLADSAADLAIYAGKYLTWLAEVHPIEFSSVPPALPAPQCSADRGPDSLRTVLDSLTAWEVATSTLPPLTEEQAWRRLERTFRALESGLLAQAEHRVAGCLRPSEKVALAWDLTDAGAWLLARLGERDPRHLDRLTAVSPRGL